MKNKHKAISIILITVVFLMPFMGNTVVSEGRGSYTWYFNSYNPFEAWETNPQYMVDGSTNNFSSTSTASDVQHLTGSTYEPTHENGTITKVEIRAHGYYLWSGNDVDIILRPVFPGGDGDDHTFDCGTFPGWSAWFDITADTNHPDPWEWIDIRDLDCDVEARPNPAGPDEWTLYCSKVEIRVTYTT